MSSSNNDARELIVSSSKQRWSGLSTTGDEAALELSRLNGLEGSLGELADIGEETAHELDSGLPTASASETWAI
jgi:hypothetical protein